MKRRSGGLELERQRSRHTQCLKSTCCLTNPYSKVVGAQWGIGSQFCCNVQQNAEGVVSKVVELVVVLLLLLLLLVVVVVDLIRSRTAIPRILSA